MNKLIIVGNGFDLAHKLPTSYKSFINYIWSNIIAIIQDSRFECLIHIDPNHLHLFNSSCENYSDFHNNTLKYFENSAYTITNSNFGNKTFRIIYDGLQYPYTNSINIFSFKNIFFELITVENIENWVDIENAYYKMLVDLAKGNNVGAISSVNQLNEDFKQIRELLQFYLENEVDNKIINNVNSIKNNSIVDIFEYNYKGLLRNKNHKYYNEFSPDLHEKLIEFDENIKDFDSFITKEKPYNYLILDFNYTSNVKNYVNVINSKSSGNFGTAEHIQIHGNLYDKNNKINFGFGDEMDDSYRILENMDNNQYLENIKSFLYLNNSNYRKLLNWIENEDFQVLILGHSCGLSDRTLLNTIFEHNNCKSIKVFYYKNGELDNFKELTQNISRHFNKKALMRKKIVDKSLCSELPQDSYYY